MRKFSSQAVALAVTVAVGLAVAGCSQIDALKGRQAFKDANGLYKSGDYKAAAAKYEESIALNPDLPDAYFFLGNSYDQLYKPSRKGEAANDALLTKAVEGYNKSAQGATTSAPIKKLALQYLVAAYSGDKLNDPAAAEPLLQQMIQLEPTDPANYFVLAKIYEDNGDYERAEATFVKAKEMKPEEPSVYTTLAAFYNRQGDFEKTIAALEERTAKDPNNPEAHHIVATYYWDKVYHDFKLLDADKRKLIQAGIDADDKAIGLKADYLEALTFKNLLLRLQANIEKDPGKQKALLTEADKLKNQAEDLQKKKAAGE